VPDNIRDLRIGVAAFGLVAGILTMFVVLPRVVNTPPTVAIHNESEAGVTVGFDEAEPRIEIASNDKQTNSFRIFDGPESIFIQHDSFGVTLRQPGGLDLNRIDITIERER
jgi:hypothetical protein